MRPSTMMWMVVLALAGCAATYRTSDKLEATQAAVSAADEAGARNVPPASYHIERAKEETEFARQQLKMGDPRGAESTLDRATADTELAAQLVREEANRQETRRVTEQLKQQMQKKGETP
jgi:hypothetical protein